MAFEYLFLSITIQPVPPANSVILAFNPDGSTTALNLTPGVTQEAAGAILFTKLGAQGWELAASSAVSSGFPVGFYIFKRQG